MVYKLVPLESLLEWAEKGGDGDVSFHMDQWAARPIPGVSPEGCGTTLCLAGKAVLDAGHRFEWSDQIDSDKEVARHVRLVTSDDRNGALRSIMEVGRGVLGLSAWEADALFVPDFSNSSENNEFALAFLRYLTERARQGVVNMSPVEVDDWVEEWSNRFFAKEGDWGDI